MYIYIETMAMAINFNSEYSDVKCFLTKFGIKSRDRSESYIRLTLIFNVAFQILGEVDFLQNVVNFLLCQSLACKTNMTVQRGYSNISLNAFVFLL